MFIMCYIPLVIRAKRYSSTSLSLFSLKISSCIFALSARYLMDGNTLGHIEWFQLLSYTFGCSFLTTYLSTSLEKHSGIADSAFVWISSHFVSVMPSGRFSTPLMAFYTPFWIKMTSILTFHKLLTLLSNFSMSSFIVDIFHQQKTPYNTVTTTFLWYQLKWELD